MVTLLGMKSCNFFVLLRSLILNFYIYSLLLLIYIVLKQFNEFDDHNRTNTEPNTASRAEYTKFIK